MIDKICEASECTACFACRNICPKNAIEIKADKNGLTYPVINESCIECGLCRQICPNNCPVTLRTPQKTFAVYSKDDKIRKKSASGGLSYQIAQEFDGIVYGAAFTDNLNVNHIRIADKAELYRIQGSKYVHSHINDAFSKVKSDLDNGLKVLFTGTPCQIAGLKNYLKKEYENLYTIDIVCHGVPERDILKNYIKKQAKNTDLSDKYVNFRDEKGWHATLRDSNNKITKEFPFNTNFYYHGFLEGWTYRENCYYCKYACPERTGDLTVCDFWGIAEPLNKELKKGLNAALIITDKGYELLNSVKDKIFIEERETAEAINGNGQLQHPIENTKNAKKFRRLLVTHNSNYALENTVLKKKIIFTLRKILKK